MNLLDLLAIGIGGTIGSGECMRFVKHHKLWMVIEAQIPYLPVNTLEVFLFGFYILEPNKRVGLF